MREFRQGGGNRSGGRSSGFGGNRGGGFRGNDRGPVRMHKVICDECKKPCEVPFMPTAGKPVYCNACFGGKKEGGINSNYRTPAKIDFRDDVKKVTGEEIKKLLESMNSKLEQLIKNLDTSKAPAVKEVLEKVKAVVKKEEVKKVAVKKAVKKVSKKK